MVGINTAISTPSGGNVGIGFAIPINMARRIMDELLESGSVSRGYLALVPQDIDEKLAGALGLDSASGALVGDVVAGGPAAEAGGGEEGGETVESKLGLGVETLTPDIARQLGVEGARGVVVASVEPGAADEAGLRRGDLIQAVNRTEVGSPADLAAAVRTLASGDRVALLVRRGGATVYFGLRLP